MTLYNLHTFVGTLDRLSRGSTQAPDDHGMRGCDGGAPADPHPFPPHPLASMGGPLPQNFPQILSREVKRQGRVFERISKARVCAGKG